MMTPDHMPPEETYQPQNYAAAMLSSTFRDLEPLRKIAIDAILGASLKPEAMEFTGARADLDLIDSSLQMVRASVAYIVLIGRRYGQIPVSPERNPGELSITELEFNEAKRLERPIYLFLMGRKYDLRDVELESDAIGEKLAAFTKQAKLFCGSEVSRVYYEFSTPQDFGEQANRVAALIYKQWEASKRANQEPGPNPVPRPPAFYAVTQYIAGHGFAGRVAELSALSQWAAPSNPHPILLFDAIGGSGKSMLTWEWTTKYAEGVRSDWAGRFWYSFYERGAYTADFCSSALAYMTGKPLAAYRKSKMPELTRALIAQLKAKPWLLVLDGLERILVEYHRIDAASVPDEDADSAVDLMAQRGSRSAIRPEDDELLRQLAAASPSKLLMTSRLIPIKLLNPATPVDGVQEYRLQGLRPEDAEVLFQSCGVHGDSPKMQHYLQNHCGCHPLVIGVLAGLVVNFLQDRGNFNAWVGDPLGGGQLDFSTLDLKRQRTHILKVGFDALPEPSRKLLLVLALVSEAVDYPTLKALNPRRPPEPAVLDWPQDPKQEYSFQGVSPDEQKKRVEEYEHQLLRWNQSQKELEAWRRPEAVFSAEKELANDVSDLDQRGFIQYDQQSKRHDLHPVVRAIAIGELAPSDRDSLGQRVVDYFSRQTHVSYQEAETLAELQGGIQVVRTLLQMGRYQPAADAYIGILSGPMLNNLDAHAELLLLELPWFPQGWGVLPDTVDEKSAVHLTRYAAKALTQTKQWKSATDAMSALIVNSLRRRRWFELPDLLIGMANIMEGMNRTAKLQRFVEAALGIAERISDQRILAMRRLDLFTWLTAFGRFDEAQAVWESIDRAALERTNDFRPEEITVEYIKFELERGTLAEKLLVDTERLAAKGKHLPTVRTLCWLRGQWHLQREDWGPAKRSLAEAVRMLRQAGISAPRIEAMLATAMFHVDGEKEARLEAERLSHLSAHQTLELARLWLELGEHDEATKCAFDVYQSAWADGERYSYKPRLDRAQALLVQLNAAIPKLPTSKDSNFPWEDQLYMLLREPATNMGGI